MRNRNIYVLKRTLVILKSFGKVTIREEQMFSRKKPCSFLVFLALYFFFQNFKIRET